MNKSKPTRKVKLEEFGEFIEGEKYRFSDIPKESTDKFEVKEYGLEYLGQNAIHIRVYREGGIDIWFLWVGMANEAIYKCIYNDGDDS